MCARHTHSKLLLQYDFKVTIYSWRQSTLKVWLTTSQVTSKPTYKNRKSGSLYENARTKICDFEARPIYMPYYIHWVVRWQLQPDSHQMLVSFSTLTLQKLESRAVAGKDILYFINYAQKQQIPSCEGHLMCQGIHHYLPKM